MKIRFEIDYPDKLEELDTSNGNNSIFIEFENDDYEVNTTLTDNTTTFCIEFQIDNETIEISQELKQRLTEKAIEIINKCISRIRTFYHEKHNFQFISPRLVKSIRLTTILNGHTENEEIILRQEMPKYLKEFFDFLNEEEAYLSLSEKLEMEQLIFLHLIIDAYYLLIERKYNECVINCATATEAYIFPELKEWIRNQLFNKNEKNAENILMEIPTALKLEMLFGSVKYDFLKHQGSLLENMKSINKHRNRIIHSGEKATKKEAEFALNNTAKLLYILYFYIDDFKE